MYLTENQVYLLSVLDETQCLTRRQAFALLRLREPWKTMDQSDAALRQLRYLSKIVYLTDDIVALSGRIGQPPDRAMLEAVDVMLDLTGTVLLRLSAHKRPFQLCFLTRLPGGGLGSYAVLPVELRREAECLQAARGAENGQRTVVFLLENWQQHKALQGEFPHYFVLREGGRRRYFKGGGA